MEFTFVPTVGTVIFSMMLAVDHNPASAREPDQALHDWQLRR